MSPQLCYNSKINKIMGHSVSASSEYRLIHAIIGTRKRSGKAFEMLYMMTLENTYADVLFSEPRKSVLWKIIEETYVKVWEKADTLPEEAALRAWIRDIIAEQYEIVTGSELTVFPDDGFSVAETNLEPEKSDTLLRIEERAGIFDAYSDDEYPDEGKQFESVEIRAKKHGREIKGKIKAIVGMLIAVGLIVVAVRITASVTDTVKNRERWQMPDMDKVIASVADTQSETLHAKNQGAEIVTKNGWTGKGYSRQFMDDKGNALTQSWMADEDGVYHLNKMGFVDMGEEDGVLKDSGKSYKLKGGAAVSIKNEPIMIYGATFRLGRGLITNKIFCDGSTLFEEGTAITGICGAGNRVYYCVVDRIENGIPVSIIKCFDMDTEYRTTLTAEFNGFARDMYYDKYNHMIYMSYCPNELESDYEELAFFDTEKKFLYLAAEDAGVLAERKHNDTSLKLLGGNETTFYCIKYKYSVELEQTKARVDAGEDAEVFFDFDRDDIVEIPLKKRKRLV